MKLFIIRHGDPDYAHDTLTFRGWQEAELLVGRLLKDNIKKVYCSPLGRAQATAKPFLEATGLDCTTYDFLQEFCVPIVTERGETCAWDLDARYFEQYEKQLTDPNDWFNNEIYKKYNVKDHVDRVWNGFDKILEDNGYKRDGMLYKVLPGTDTGKNIAIFCHGGLGALLLARIMHMAPSHAWQMFRIMPTGVTTVLFSGRDYAQAKVMTVSDMTHLEPIGLTYRW